MRRKELTTFVVKTKSASSRPSVTTGTTSFHHALALSCLTALDHEMQLLDGYCVLQRAAQHYKTLHL